MGVFKHAFSFFLAWKTYTLIEMKKEEFVMLDIIDRMFSLRNPRMQDFIGGMIVVYLVLLFAEYYYQ